MGDRALGLGFWGVCLGCLTFEFLRASASRPYARPIVPNPSPNTTVVVIKEEASKNPTACAVVEAETIPPVVALTIDSR